jgi:hypothetical protein
LNNAFHLKKGGKESGYSQDQIDTFCANLSFSFNYFANDFKIDVSTDCLEKHVGKQRRAFTLQQRCAIVSHFFLMFFFLCLCDETA